MMRITATVWCFAPWIIAAGTSLVGWIDPREAVRLTAFLFFLLYPATVAAAIVVARSEAAWRPFA
jgi:hypothetical protein